MQIRVNNQAGILDAVVPTMRDMANIGTWTGFFFPAAAKLTLPFKTPGYGQAQSMQSLVSLIGLSVCTELIEGGAV
jgi:uncharacterized protein (DUF1810 family)